MSEQIDVNVVAIGGESVDAVTSSLDRLTGAMERLGNNSALDRLAQQMELMQATMVTGFANLAATSDKMIQSMSMRQVQAVEDGAAKTASAIEAAGLKIKAADARTWEQIGRGSAASVTSAFYQLSQGIPVEAVEARFGQMATAAAQSLDGQLEKLKQFQANAKSLFQTNYRPMAGATEAEMQQAAAMNAQFDAAAAAAHQALVEKRDLEEYRIRSAASAELQALIEKRDMEEYRARSAASAELRALIEKRDLEEYQMRSAAAQRIVEIEQRRDLELHSMRTAEAQRLAEIQQRRDMEEYTAAQAQAQRMIEIEQRRDMELHNMRTAAAADAATQAERQRSLNTNFLTASPASQVHIARQAQTYAGLGGDAEAKYGSVAAGADALAAAQARLAASSRGAAVTQLEMNDVLKQAEGAFKGAAHQAGLYGLHHGQLIALLAGGAVAAALHHIAETGAEVEFQLKSLNALSGDMTPVNIDKFIGISAGTMTSLTDAAEGVHALAQAGLTQAEAFRALPDVMRLAQLGEMHVAQAAEMAVESMHAFGLTSADIGRVGDTLVAVGSQANVSVHKLAEDMKSAAVTGQLFNLSMEEITATVGALAERGLTIQPLSSALNKLYEPSAKVAKVMQDMHLSVRDAAGQFKPYTDFIHELSDKVNEYKEAGDPLKMLGMSTQSIKAMEVMTQHIENYDHLLHTAKDSANKMFEASAAKADTVEGAWKQLGSTLQGSMVKAFEEAEPTIRQIENDLLGIAGSSDVQNFFTQLATGVANVTRALIENRGTIEAALLGYVGLRVVPPILEAVASASVFLFGRTVATTAAIAAEGTTAAVAGGQLDLFAVSETAAAAGATEVAAAATTAEVVLTGFAAATRTALSVLGPLGLALAAVSVGYELFRGASTKAEQDHDRMSNSIDSTITSMKQELDHLNNLQEQLEKTGRIGAESAYKVQLAFAQMEEAKAKADLDAAAAAAKGPRKLEAGDDGTLTQFSSNESSSDLANARAAYDKAHARSTQLEQLHGAIEKGREAVQIGNDITKLEDKIKTLPRELEGLAASSPQKADALRDQVTAMGKLVITKDNYNDTLKQEKELEAAINAGKRSTPASAAGDKDSARVRIEQLQEELRLAQMLSKVAIDNAKSENKRGELGDLQLINRERDENLKLHQKALDIARAEAAASSPLKPGQQEKYSSRVKSAEMQLKVDDAVAKRQIEDALDKMDGLELAARAKTLESRGHLEEAFLMTWEEKNRKTLDNLNSDIADSENAQYRDRLERFKHYLEEQRALGANAARFQEGKDEFSAAQATLRQRLEDARSQKGPGSGLYSILSSSMQEQDAYGDMLPKLQAAQAEVAPTSSIMRGGDATKIKEARNELRSIQQQMADMRNLGVDMGNAIAKALGDAFGKGGQALGGMIVTATAYDAKMKEIQATLAASGKTETDKQAAADATASAQIKAYGDMAGAAKGFFNTNSSGYRMLATAEKAFRALELAQAAEALAKKLFFKGAEVTATVTGDAVKATSGTAATAVDVVNAGTSASAWGSAAIAKALASLPPPLSYAAAAATAAMLVGAGVKLLGGGGGGGESKGDREQRLVSGTVLGDPDAQSQSISKSLAAIKDNTYNNLPIAQGMLAALQSIESNISSFSSLLMRTSDLSGSNANLSKLTTTSGFLGLGALGNLASRVPLIGGAIGKVSSSIFGGKQSLDASGFTVGKSSLGQIMSHGVNAMSYADVTTSGGWFRSDRHDTKTTPLGAEANAQVSSVITGIGDAIRQSADMLGMSGSAFDARLKSFVVDIGKIDLKGLSSSDAQAKIEAAFSKLGDQMAQFSVSGLEQFQKAGEGYLQTLMRVATDYATVDTVFKSFGSTYALVGTASIAAREHLIDLAGGLDKFTSQASWFLQNMMTSGQRTAATLASIQPTLDKYGLKTTGRDAVKQFADLTIAMGAMGPAGAQAYTDLMNIAQAFKSVTDVAADLQKQIDDLTMTQAQKDAAARAELDPQNQLLFDQVQKAKAVAQAKSDLASAYQTESQSMQSAIDRLKSFSTSLRTFVTSLVTGTSSTLNPADKYGAALAQFNSTLEKARAGDTTAQGNLQSAAQTFLQASREANASNTTYQSDFDRVTSAMLTMANTADAQANSGQASLNALYQQVSKLTTLNASVNTVADGINNLAVIMSGGKDKATNNQAITTLYRELLGRAPDFANLDYWGSMLESGSSLATVMDKIKHLDEYTAYQNAKGSTSDVTPSTSYGTAKVPDSDPYAKLVMQNDSTIRILSMLRTEMAALRAEAATQSDQQVHATMAAGSNVATKVSGAVETASTAAVWATDNTARLR